MRIYVIASLLVLTLLLTAFSLVHSLNVTSSWSIQTVDKFATTGSGSIALDSKNNPHIVYNVYLVMNRTVYERTWEVMHANWNGSSWNTTTAIQNATYQDFVMDSNDNPQILYANKEGQQNLMYAKWTGSSWVTQTVDRYGRGGSVALDSAGNPHIAYTANNQLNYASWTGTNWETQIVDAPGSLEGPKSHPITLAFGANSTAHIMYSTDIRENITSFEYSTNIKYAVGNGANWNVETIFENCDLGNMVLDSNCNPNLIYFKNTQRLSTIHPAYASWNGTDWNTITFPTPPSKPSWIYESANLALDPHDCPHIVYFNRTRALSTGSLMYATWADNNWDFQTIDPSNATAIGSVVVDSKGIPHINYYAQAPDRSLYSPLGDYLNYATSTESTQPDALMPTAELYLLIAAPVIVVTALIILAYIWKKG